MARAKCRRARSKSCLTGRGARGLVGDHQGMQRAAIERLVELERAAHHRLDHGQLASDSGSPFCSAISAAHEAAVQ